METLLAIIWILMVCAGYGAILGGLIMAYITWKADR